MKKLIVLSILAVSAVAANAQVLLSGGLSYSQNFDTLASATVGTTATWTDNSTLAGWYASRAVTATTTSAYGPYAYAAYRIDAGTSTGGTLYSYGVAGVNPVTDRALGSLSSGTPKTNAIGVSFQNDTASAVDTITISYTGEQWRNGGNTAVQSLTFSYRIYSPAGAFAAPLDTLPASWTAFSALTFNSPTTGAVAAALDGNATANQTAFSSILLTGVTLNAGDAIIFRWVDVDDSGSDHGLAVDNFSASFSVVVVPEPSTLALAGLGGLGLSLLRRRR